MCGKKGENVQHIISGCEKLAKRESKRRQDNVAKKVHWDICKKSRLEQLKVVWTRSESNSREWSDQSAKGHKYPEWQSNRGKATWPNSYWQERTKGDN